MSLDWNLIWKILQVVALLIIVREIDKRRLILAPDCGLGLLSRKLCFQKLKIITKVAKSFINY